MRFARIKPVVALAGASVLLATACSSLDSPSTGASSAAGSAASGGTIKIGYVTPLTGPLAAFGEGDQWVVDQMTAYFKEHPISAGGTTYSVEILLKDSQSDPKRAGEVAGELINTDAVDILMAHATPETTVPVAAQCEANATPCITADTPWQPWVAGLGGNPGDPSKPFAWSYHFFWGLEDMAAVFMDMWNQVDSNKKVAALYPNDADGQAFTDKAQGFPAIIGPAGFTFDNPGLYPERHAGLLVADLGLQEERRPVAATASCRRRTSSPSGSRPSSRATTRCWRPSARPSSSPRLSAALGDLAQNLGTEVWWAPSYPTTSSLTGLSSAGLRRRLHGKATGKQWNVTLGFSESLFEVAAAAVTAAGGKDKQKVAAAMKSMKVNSLVGTLDWTKGPFPNIAKTPLTGGQWRKTDGGKFPYELVIVSNSVAKELGLDVPLGGKVEPLLQPGRAGRRGPRPGQHPRGGPMSRSSRCTACRSDSARSSRPRTSPFASSRARRWASSAPTVPASRPCSPSSAASCRRMPARSASTARTSPRLSSGARSDDGHRSVVPDPPAVRRHDRLRERLRRSGFRRPWPGAGRLRPGGGGPRDRRPLAPGQRARRASCASSTASGSSWRAPWPPSPSSSCSTRSPAASPRRSCRR